MSMNSHNNQTNEADKGFDPTTTIIFDDSIIEIQYNDLLKNKPYLVKLTGYISEYYETRMSCEELRALADFINYYLDNKYNG